MPSIEDRIDELYELANAEWKNGHFEKVIELLSEGWSLLPEPKNDHPESHHLADYFIDTYLHLNDILNAKKWSDTIFRCDPSRIDSGERDFLAGKVAFHAGNMNEASKYFKIADEKSSGRCFIDVDEKYQELIGSTKQMSFNELVACAENDYKNGLFSRALNHFYDALNYPEALESATIYLRKGQCHFQLEELKLAEKDLAKAYMLGGIEIFKNESPKYLDFHKTKIELV